MFCNRLGQHLDTAIRFPSLAPILAPYFSPQPDSADFIKMYSLVMERLNRGHTALAFSLLSKFQVGQFAASCAEGELNKLIFAIKSGLFALSGDADGESNLEFDLPDSSDSKELVQDQLVRHSCEVMSARPGQTAEPILQTVLQITSQGDGFSSCWKNIEATFSALGESGEAAESVGPLLNLISGHFGTMRAEQDLYQSPVWVPLLGSMASIIGAILTIPNTSYLTPEQVAEQVELVFSAVEPFLQPRREPNGTVKWPTHPESKLFWDVLTRRVNQLNSVDPGSTQRHFCLNLIGLISFDSMPEEYLTFVVETVDKVHFTDLVPTSELVDLVSELLTRGHHHTTTIAAIIVVDADWSMLFSVASDESSISMLLSILLFIISESFPIHRLGAMRERFLAWREYPWDKLSNETLRGLLIDLPPRIAIDSFVHPTSCHRTALELIRTVALSGVGNSLSADIERRRIWMGCVGRAIRRNGVNPRDQVVSSRIADFIRSQLEWVKIGIPPDQVHEELVTTGWGDLFHVLNCNGQLLPFFIDCAKDERDLATLRLFIATASRVIREPVPQLMLIETCVEQAMQLGHGLSLLHGALCSLPMGGRDELRGSLAESQSLLTPLLLLQEQLRPNLPDTSKAKLLSQNAFYVKGGLIQQHLRPRVNS